MGWKRAWVRRLGGKEEGRERDWTGYEVAIRVAHSECRCNFRIIVARFVNPRGQAITPDL